MVIDEIYPNPTVKKVIFEIRFPSLFSLENRMGDIQEKIMKEFPDSKLLLRSGFIVADVGSDQKIEIPPEDLDKNAARKIWQFRSKNNTILNIQSGSLDLVSVSHKTYDLGEDNDKKFRCAIKYAVDAFLDVFKLATINRIGLRYIDHCPLPTKRNSTLKRMYNTSFPLNRFDIADAGDMVFQAVLKQDKYNLRYVEALRQVEGEDKLILDFDGFALDVQNVADYLTITDELHTIILDAYHETIKEPVYKYMRETGRKERSEVRKRKI
jgi:uncharacterized protein (TIGR04255 family)